MNWDSVLARILQWNRTNRIPLSVYLNLSVSYPIYLSICLAVYLSIKRERERQISFKELLHVIAGAGKSDLCRKGWQPGNTGKSKYCNFQSKLIRAAGWTFKQAFYVTVWGLIPSFGRNPQAALGISTDWIRPTHSVEGNPLYSKPNDFNANHTFKIPSQWHLYWGLTKQLGTVASQVDI